MRRAAPWLALALILCGVAAVRLRLADLPLERDEGGYAYFAERMLDGVAPFNSGYTMHLPGTAAGYAASMIAFGRSARGVRLGLLVANALTIVFAFLLSSRASGRLGGVAAAAAYAVLSVSPEVLGPFGHANHFVTLFGAAGLWALAIGQASGRLAWLAGAGLLLGLAPVMKQSGAVFPTFGIAWLAWSRWRAGAAWRTTTRELLMLAATSLAGVTMTFALLGVAGALPKAWFWTYTYARAYSGMETLAEGLRNLAGRLSRIAPVSLGFLLLAAAGGVIPETASDERRPLAGRAYPLALLVATFASACPGLYFRQHYFIPVLLPLSLLCGRGVAALAGRGPALRFAGASAALVAAAAQSVAAQEDVLLRLSPAEISRKVYGGNPFPESVEVGRYLASHTLPGDRIAVMGSEPEILFYAHRLSATGYLYLYPLVEPNPLGPRMKDELMREVAAADPRYIVWVDVPASWNFRVGAAASIVRWAGDLIESRYALDGRVVILSRETRYAWGDEARRQGLEGASLLLFRRIDP